MSEKEETFRCIACNEEKPKSDLVCWKCIQAYIDNVIKDLKTEQAKRLLKICEMAMSHFQRHEQEYKRVFNDLQRMTDRLRREIQSSARRVG